MCSNLKYILFYFLLPFNLYSQLNLNDPKLNKLLMETGMSLQEAKKIVGNNTNLDLNQNSNIKDPVTQGAPVDDAEVISVVNEAVSLDVANDVTSSIEDENLDIPIPDDAELDIVETNDEDFEYFGYNIFNQDPELFQKGVEESVDPDYQVGPGDEVIIMLWGETEFNNKYTISRDGYLFIENVGQVFVNGLNLDKLEKKLFRLMKKFYSSLDPSSGKPSTFFDVSLGSLILRPLRIFALGDVDQPGAYNVKPTTSLFTSLYYFNGPTTHGSLRDIKLIRGGEVISTIDFYSFLTDGLQKNDSRLQRDDIIFVPSRGKTVLVKGQIKRNKYFELKASEGLKDLINYAGGLNSNTYLKRAQINRVIPKEDRTNYNTNEGRTIVDVSLENLNDENFTYNLHDGDIITFFEIGSGLTDYVNISGAVNRPGDYDYKPGLLLSDLIKKADNTTGDAFLERVDIFRQNDDNTETHINVNLESIMVGDVKGDLELKSKDRVVIHQLSKLLFNSDVRISGHVQLPRSLPFRRNMTIYDLVFLGGGFNNSMHLANAHKERADLIRWNDEKSAKNIIPFNLDSLLEGDGIADLEVKMGDEVVIYSKNEVQGDLIGNITVLGYVKNPGIYEFYDNLEIEDILFLYAGFDDEEYFSKVFLNRADIYRFNKKLGEQEIISIDLNNILDSTKTHNYEILPDDEIRFFSKEMFKSESFVNINGSISTPGQYRFRNSMSLFDLILEAGGLKPDIFKYKAEIASIDPQNASEDLYAKIITHDLVHTSESYYVHHKNSKKSSNRRATEIILSPYDIVTVRPDPYFSSQKRVNITGAVYYPGDYTISSPNEKITDIISRAGGLRKNAYPAASKFVRNNETINLSFTKIIRNPKSRLNFSVLDGDSIVINTFPNIVKIEGAVSVEGNYQYIKGLSMRDYIKMAGGFTDIASKKSAYMIYPDGNTYRYKVYGFSPAVLDGSKIVVPSINPDDKFNITEFFNNASNMYNSISQFYLLAIIANR